MSAASTTQPIELSEGMKVLGHTVGTLSDVGTGYFLSNLATDWDHRGKGEAGRFMAALCAEADAHHTALHLVPGNEELQSWYARLGFEVDLTERGIGRMPYMTRAAR